jgi:hypothetical protein
VLGGCGSTTETRRVAVAAGGPPNVVRVALTDFRWPVDPALARSRDETTLARALYATPLKIDPASGAPVAGLCRGWTAADGFRTWRFTCRNAPAIAAAIRRVGRLPTAPLRALVADAHVTAPAANRLVVRLPFAWRRFPYLLTTVATAPRFVQGPFKLVSGSPQQVVVRSPNLTAVFRRFPSALGADRAFERGEVDEAPLPAGGATWARTRFGDVVHTRTLLALDGVLLRRLMPALRRVYWQTADRNDYAELVPESRGAAALSILGTKTKASPRAYRAAIKAIRTLPRVRVRIGVPPNLELRSGALILYAQWRDVGLGPELVTQPARALDGSFVRLFAAYPQAEALPAALVLSDRTGSRPLLLDALAADDQRAALARFDRDLQSAAGFVPVSWVVDSRLVSPRLRGWSEDALGDVDYAGVRSLASSRSP